jgi:hypothetical protein
MPPCAGKIDVGPGWGGDALLALAPCQRTFDFDRIERPIFWVVGDNPSTLSTKVSIALNIEAPHLWFITNSSVKSINVDGDNLFCLFTKLNAAYTDTRKPWRPHHGPIPQHRRQPQFAVYAFQSGEGS